MPTPTKKTVEAKFADVLKFRVPIWYDPVPPDLLKDLSQATRLEIAKLQLQAHQDILAVHTKAASAYMNVLKGAGR